MHIEIGIISPEKLAYAGVAATAPSRAHRSHRRSREAGVSRAP